jgi:nucleoside-diphosphate-sugar epimerase
MERTQLFDLMGELKLYGMKDAFDEIMATAVKRQHEPQRIVGDLLKAEINEKQARSIKYQLTFLALDKAIPHVATRDIGTAAARLLADGGSGKRVIELGGPREYTPRDVAAAVERTVGNPIDVQQAPEEAMGCPYGRRHER